MTDQPYVFYPSKYSPALGHPRLDIYLSKNPTHRYFDTRRARFFSVQSGAVEPVVVDHPWGAWLGDPEQRVVAGRITMIDHQDNTHDAFSMGGNLSIQNEDEFTICTLVSSAPIFNLQDHHTDALDSPTQLLVQGFEELFAVREAHWLSDDSIYPNRLAAVEPLTLFVSALSALEKKYSAFPVVSRSDRILRTIQTVQHAIHLLKDNGDWPPEVPELEEIL